MAGCTIKFEFSVGDTVRVKGHDIPGWARVREISLTPDNIVIYDVVLRIAGTRWACGFAASELELVEDGDKAEEDKP